MDPNAAIEHASKYGPETFLFVLFLLILSSGYLLWMTKLAIPKAHKDREMADAHKEFIGNVERILTAQVHLTQSNQDKLEDLVSIHQKPDAMMTCAKTNECVDRISKAMAIMAEFVEGNQYDGLAARTCARRIRDIVGM